MDRYPLCSCGFPWVKTVPTPLVTSLNLGTKTETSKFLLSETIWRRALIFDMSHHLYQSCTYDAPGVKTGPIPSVTGLNIETKTEILKILLL